MIRAPLDALEAISVESSCPKRGKKHKAKKKKRKEDPQQSRCAEKGPGPVAAVVSAPREKETPTPPPEQSQESPLACFTNSHGATKEEDPNGQEWLLSLTDRLDAMGPSKFRLPEGWMNFEEEEFSSVVTDALAAAGVHTADLPEGWTTFIRKKKVPTLSNLPPHLFVDKMATPDIRNWRISGSGK